MKKVFIILALAFLLSPVMTALADDSTTTTTPTIQDGVKTQEDAADSAISAYKNAGTTERQQRLVTVGDRVVTVRQAALTALLKRVNSGTCSGISASVKQVITADIQAISTSLTTEQTAIDKNSSLDTDKTEVKAVYTNNRVFARFVPAIHGICASEKIIELVSGTKITAALTELKADGIDTTAINTDLTSAKASAQAALILFEKIATNPGDGNTTAVTDLTTAIHDLNSARQSLADAKTAIDKAIDSVKGTTSTDTSN